MRDSNGIYMNYPSMYHMSPMPAGWVFGLEKYSARSVALREKEIVLSYVQPVDLHV